MKRFLLIIFLTPVLSKAQINDTALRKAGTEFIRYEKQYSAGTAIQLAGLAIAIAGSATQETNDKTSIRTPLIVGGGLLSLAGFIMQVSSASHIKKAGIYLRGDRLIIPLRKKK